MRRIKIEVRLLKAEQANCWRIVAATAPVKRPRISSSDTQRSPGLRAAPYYRVNGVEQ
jgi:hypothetical protein